MASLKAVGFRQAIRNLRTLGPRVQRNQLKRAAHAMAEVLEREVEARTPVKTGVLKGHVKVHDLPSTGRTARSEVSVSRQDFGGTSWYGAAEEYGTSRQQGAHAMGRAIATASDKALRAGGQVLLAGIEREIG